MLTIKLTTFLKSLIWHIRRGLPKSSQTLINYRYQICFGCENFDKKHRECLVCGCNISTKKVFLNKLAWADQKCPIDKW
jgi:hypothetical protein